jgi:16S rRNA (cytidine1402-2'-O)-methyltransferase
MTQVSFKDKKPTLFVVSTPIGNLSDITYRAVETLKNVTCCYAEDTRTTAVLFRHYGIDTRLESYHAHSTESRTEDVLERLSKGEDVALVSDAGTPLVSDPGEGLVKAVIRSGYHVVAIPGASASLAALVSSGQDAQPFVFLGFLPRKSKEMGERLNAYRGRRETLVILEAPSRLSKTLPVLLDVLGDRTLSVCRELTKTFETITRTTLGEAVGEEFPERGEYTLVIGGDTTATSYDHLSINEHVRRYIDAGETEKDAMKKTAADRNISKSDVYKSYKIDT